MSKHTASKKSSTKNAPALKIAPKPEANAPRTMDMVLAELQTCGFDGDAVHEGLLAMGDELDLLSDVKVADGNIVPIQAMLFRMSHRCRLFAELHGMRVDALLRAVGGQS